MSRLKTTAYFAETRHRPDRAWIEDAWIERAIHAPEIMNWHDAKSYCASLSLAGGGWRLPSVFELLSLIDKSRPSGEQIASAFPHSELLFWTASPWVDGLSAWFVAFDGGGNWYSNTSSPYHVRCVRTASGELVKDQAQAAAWAAGGGQTSEGMYDRAVAGDEVDGPPLNSRNKTKYRDNHDGTVWDLARRATWQRQDSGKDLEWHDAKAYCAELGLSGSGWRLPSIFELLSLVDQLRQGGNRVASAFQKSNSIYWTASPTNSSWSSAFVVYFDFGVTNVAGTLNKYRVRCVRTRTVKLGKPLEPVPVVEQVHQQTPEGAYDSAVPPSELKLQPEGSLNTTAYRDNVDGTVADPVRQVTWQRQDSAMDVDWSEAKAYCARLSLLGRSWRLPSVFELL